MRFSAAAAAVTAKAFFAGIWSSRPPAAGFYMSTITVGVFAEAMSVLPSKFDAVQHLTLLLRQSRPARGGVVVGGPCKCAVKEHVLLKLFDMAESQIAALAKRSSCGVARGAGAVTELDGGAIESEKLGQLII